MERSKILPAVEKAVADREPAACKWYWLCYKDGKICCLAGGVCAQPEIWFVKLTLEQIDKGLKSSEWSAIENRIFNILNQKGLI